MFTGIIETLGIVRHVEREQQNLILTMWSSITSELKVDQSVSHNGICLTVTEIDQELYKVTAVLETIEKTCIGNLKEGDVVNLERAMKLGDRLDGHLVQGHVDQTAVCESVQEAGGSWYFTFSYDIQQGNITIEKGSITINGVSLTVIDSGEGSFSVAIIPYTFEHTNFHTLKAGDCVNLEFDLIGKYISRLYSGNNL